MGMLKEWFYVGVIVLLMAAIMLMMGTGCAYTADGFGRFTQGVGKDICTMAEPYMDNHQGYAKQ
jgi:hypothetical protein